MRQLSQNKKTLYYANFEGNVPIYARDSQGNILVQEIDGESVKVVESYVNRYGMATAFKANISYNSGDTEIAEYGLNTSDYHAIISANKGELPFDERTLIWDDSDPLYDAKGDIRPESADYRVVAIKTSLNEERFILKKRVDDEEKVTPSA